MGWEKKKKKKVSVRIRRTLAMGYLYSTAFWSNDSVIRRLEAQVSARLHIARKPVLHEKKMSSLKLKDWPQISSRFERPTNNDCSYIA